MKDSDDIRVQIASPAAQEPPKRVDLTAAASSSKYADAMAKLSPPAQAFVKQLVSMGPLMKGLRDTAQGAFLPGLTDMLRDSEACSLSSRMSCSAPAPSWAMSPASFGDMFKSPEFQVNLTTLLRSAEPIIRALGNGMVDITGSLVGFGAKMAPASEALGRFDPH